MYLTKKEAIAWQFNQGKRHVIYIHPWIAVETIKETVYEKMSLINSHMLSRNSGHTKKIVLRAGGNSIPINTRSTANFHLLSHLTMPFSIIFDSPAHSSELSCGNVSLATSLSPKLAFGTSVLERPKWEGLPFG